MCMSNIVNGWEEILSVENNEGLNMPVSCHMLFVPCSMFTYAIIVLTKVRYISVFAKCETTAARLQGKTNNLQHYEKNAYQCVLPKLIMNHYFPLFCNLMGHLCVGLCALSFLQRTLWQSFHYLNKYAIVLLLPYHLVLVEPRNRLSVVNYRELHPQQSNNSALV